MHETLNCFKLNISARLKYCNRTFNNIARVNHFWYLQAIFSLVSLFHSSYNFSCGWAHELEDLWTTTQRFANCRIPNGYATEREREEEKGREGEGGQRFMLCKSFKCHALSTALCNLPCP